MKRSAKWIALVAWACACFVQPVHALTDSVEHHHFKATVYAPDWIWQTNAVNVLIVLENEGLRAGQGTVTLSIPEEIRDHFDFEPPVLQPVAFNLPPDETKRIAFTHIVPRSGFPLQTYPLELEIEHNGTARTIAYPLTTIRGPVVRSATWAALLPAFICAVFCIAFVIYLRRHAAPRAWRTSGESAGESKHPESWIDARP